MPNQRLLSMLMAVPDALEQSDLSGMDLRDTDFSGVSFKGANLTGCILTGSNLSRVNFEGATLDGAVLHSVHADGAILTGSTEGASFKGARLTRCRIVAGSGSDFRESEVTDCVFVSVGKHVTFHSASISGTTLGKSLYYPDFRSAKLTRCTGGGHWWVVDGDTSFDGFVGSEAVTGLVAGRHSGGTLLDWLVQAAVEHGAYIRDHYDGESFDVVKQSLADSGPVFTLARQIGATVQRTDKRCYVFVPKTGG